MEVVDGTHLIFDADVLNWDGGDLHWEGDHFTFILLLYHFAELFSGAHNPFCEVCGGAKEQLFGCQTCNMSCHADCMTTSPLSGTASDYWFCPHCIDNGFHVPPVAPVTVESRAVEATIVSDNAKTAAPLRPTKSISDFEECVSKAPRDRETRVGSLSKTVSTSYTEQGSLPDSATIVEEHSLVEPKGSVLSSVSVSASQKRERTTSGKGTAKKRSKYSAYSSEVDKALATIRAELEVAADVRRSEEQLHERIKSLEQQLKLQDGQIALLKREADLSKRALEVEKFKLDRLSQSIESSNEVVKLKELLVNRDNELASWKEKLKALVG